MFRPGVLQAVCSKPAAVRVRRFSDNLECKYDSSCRCLIYQDSKNWPGKFSDYFGEKRDSISVWNSAAFIFTLFEICPMAFRCESSNHLSSRSSKRLYGIKTVCVFPPPIPLP